jgi:hypothetical protein
MINTIIGGGLIVILFPLVSWVFGYFSTAGSIARNKLEYYKAIAEHKAKLPDLPKVEIPEKEANSDTASIREKE